MKKIIFTLIFGLFSLVSYAEEMHTLEKAFTISSGNCEIQATDKADFNKYYYKLTGKSTCTEKDIILKTQEILNNVSAILEVEFSDKIVIEIHSSYSKGKVAFYCSNSKKIIIYADRVTDGILAHEIAHAILDIKVFQGKKYYKIHEIIARHIDQHLWEGAY